MPKALTKRQMLACTIKEMELQSLLKSDSDSELEADILYLNHLLTKQYLQLQIAIDTAFEQLQIASEMAFEVSRGLGLGLKAGQLQIAIDTVFEGFEIANGGFPGWAVYPVQLQIFIDTAFEVSRGRDFELLMGDVLAGLWAKGVMLARKQIGGEEGGAYPMAF
ncbi:hypothetical protein PPACK8108_LOCUS26134 [Phakopsora pachyrhizi]|uniref:Uncharacterized protein n=1 Tax=Phakopsora pachyrhizi TaxID=170000 RepID=A0AAV0BTE3_PHAPC|nr:hypothetical protein PPACK8108_LOCUS26134 [Phakopsora pachyrhizi]